MKEDIREKLIKEYFPEIYDINQSATIRVLPLTIVDILIDYEEILNDLSDPQENSP